MLNLYELQVAFQKYLLTAQPTINTQIVTTKHITTKTRLEIYREAYYLRLLEVLQQDYEILHTLLGDEQFDRLGRNYIDNYPSHYRTVRWFGKDFPDYIKQSLEQEYLFEIATFEWLLTESFDANNSSIVTLENMSIIPSDQWPDLTFELHPSVKKLTIRWNILPTWHAINNNETIDLPEKLAKTQHILIWRKTLNVQFSSLTEEQMCMLNAIIAGKNFAALCEDLCQWTDEDHVAMLAAQLLKQFILDHVISRVLLL